MSKFFVVLLIVSLILSTALIKNSTKRVDDDIFILKENIRSLKKDFENIALENNYLSSGESSFFFFLDNGGFDIFLLTFVLFLVVDFFTFTS